MTVKPRWPQKKHIGFILILYRIGAIMGLLPIRYNPLKSRTKDEAFDTYWLLVIYSCFLWVMNTHTSVHVIKILYIKAPHILSIVLLPVISIQLIFVFWIVMVRKSVPQIMNKLSRLIQDSSNLQISFIELLLPYIPMAIIFPLKMVLNLKWILIMPPLCFVDVFQSLGMIYTNGLIYTWIIYGEKLYFNITQHIKLKLGGLSANMLKPLMSQSLDTEAFLYSISKSFGIPYLILSIFTVSVDIMYSNDAMSSVVPASHEPTLQYFQNLINFVYWNYSLYIMACVCYRSHNLSIQVKKLKWSLDEVQAKRTLDNKILQMVRLFENRIDDKKMYFSAFGSINFNISLLIIVLHKIITYLFAINPMREPE